MGACCASSPPTETISFTGQPMQPPHIIIVAGPPASGKGTLCDALKRNYGLVHICPGQLLREQAEKQTPLGNRVLPHLESGRLVPHALVTDVIRERFLQPDVMSRGCLFDNFPLTIEQASAMKQHFRIDGFLYIEVPREVLAQRALGRRLDPITGNIYHLNLAPPPADVLPRLVRRKDDDEKLVEVRLQTYERHIDEVLPIFGKSVRKLDGTAAAEKLLRDAIAHLDALEWTTEEAPYFGNAVFNGPFSAVDAKRAGFFSPADPPGVGDHVVCFRRGKDWNKYGTVTEVEERPSDGIGGLKAGEDGVRVTVELERNRYNRGGSPVNEPEPEPSLQAWSAFLAPVNDMEYSSICTVTQFLSSNFARFYDCKVGLGDASPVSQADARASLQKWLQNLVDVDEEEVELESGVEEEVMATYDQAADACLYLYSSQQKLGPRTSLVPGQDYSIFYRALNNTLNSDAPGNLENAMPFIRRMIYLLLYSESDGSKLYHAGGRVWKGDLQAPVPLNMHKLREAQRLGRQVRFRQFQSTSVDESLADKYRRREDGRGFKWVIDIPPHFWGARDIRDLSWKEKEHETLFPPYSAFHVGKVDADSCHLVAIDRHSGLSDRAARHGLRGTAVELLRY